MLKFSVQALFVIIMVLMIGHCKSARRRGASGVGGMAPVAETVSGGVDPAEYKVDDKHQLLKRAPGGQWTVIEQGVTSIERAPNGDVMVISDSQKNSHQIKMISGGITKTLGTFSDQSVLMLSNSSEPSATTMAIPAVNAPEMVYLPEDRTEYALDAQNRIVKRSPGERDWTVLMVEAHYYPPVNRVDDNHPDGVSTTKTVYRFTSTNELEKRRPGSVDWTPLDPRDPNYGIKFVMRTVSQTGQLVGHGTRLESVSNIQTFKKAPNGYLYVLNRQHELRIIRRGESDPILRVGTKSLEMDPDGTVSSLDWANQLESNSSPKRTLVLPSFDEQNPVSCAEPPSPAEIARALHLTSVSQYFEPGPNEPAQNGVFPDASSPFSRIFMISEPIADRVENSKLFPGFGLGRFHVCQFKTSVYMQTKGDGITRHQILYYGKNYVHRFLGTAAAAPALAAGVASTPVSSGVKGPRVYQNAASVSVGSDGIMYRLGLLNETADSDSPGGYIGKESGPLELWRLLPGALWRSMGYVYSFGDSAEGTLYILNANHELKSLAKGSTQWKTVEVNLIAFAMSPSGTLYILGKSGQLKMMVPGTNRWTLLDSGVETFSMAPDGTVNALNSRRQLERLVNGAKWTILDTGVVSAEWAQDGIVYELNNRRQLKRLSVSGVWTSLDTNITSFRRDVAGVLYSLNTRNELKQLTSVEWEYPGDVWALKKQKYSLNWKLIASNVNSFVVAPSALNNVYVLSKSRALTKFMAGVWNDLKVDIKSLDMDPDGQVRAIDAKNIPWLFAPRYLESNVEKAMDDERFFCTNIPTPEDFLKAAHMTPGNGITAVAEPRMDQTDPARLFPAEGPADHVDPAALYPLTDYPAQVHQCAYQGTINFAPALHKQSVNIYIERTRTVNRWFQWSGGVFSTMTDDPKFMGAEYPSSADRMDSSQQWMK